MKAIGIFEVKTKISEICETVKETHEPVIITKRGVPMVKITTIEDSEKQSDIWVKHKKFIEKNEPLIEEFSAPSRKVDLIINLTDD